MNQSRNKREGGFCGKFHVGDRKFDRKGSSLRNQIPLRLTLKEKRTKRPAGPLYYGPSDNLNWFNDVFFPPVIEQK